MSEYISHKDRAHVAERANFCCEYCLMPERFSLFKFHIDHIISLKHGGETQLDNLAFSCGFCNSNKGTDLGTFLTDTEQLIRFFHPRKDSWSEHFELLEGGIYGITPIGEATVKMLQFNDIERILERKLLVEKGFIKL